MDEIEVKFKISDSEEIRKKLKSLGAVREELVFEKNMMFNNSDRTFLKDHILRLRDGKKLIITYKGPVDKGHEFKKREEINLEVNDSDRAIELLIALGYKPDNCYEKKRETWYLGTTTIEIDEVPVMGFFVEIEGATEEIKKVIQQLGFDEKEKIIKMYYDIWIDYQKQNKMKINHDMVFENGLQKNRPEMRDRNSPAAGY